MCCMMTGLIETWDVLKPDYNQRAMKKLKRLIETWDVLKLSLSIANHYKSMWLIETWDVLKPYQHGVFITAYAINRNMRCIET